MSDLISREELLKQIETDSKGHEGQYGDEWLFIDTINSIPSAEPKLGKWEECEAVDVEDTTITEVQSAFCSICHKYHTTPYMYYFDYFNYCPNCGAKMERRVDERKKITIERNICPKPECGDEFPIPKEGWKGASDDLSILKRNDNNKDQKN